VPALVRDLFEKDEYALVTGLIMLVMGIAPLVAPTLGGIIVSHGSWRWVFLALSGIAFATSLLFLRLVHETLPAERRHGFDVGHILRNYLRLLRHRAGLGYLVTGAASFSGMLVFIVTSPYVYIELYGVPTEYFGLLFGVNVLLAMIVSSLNARYVKRLGAEWLLRLGLAVQLAAALAMLALALVGGSQPLWPVASGAALYIGMSGLVPGNATAGFMSFFPRLAGTASAFSGTLRFGLGATVGTIVSLFHSETAAPLLVGMAACGLTAVGSYWLVCSAISTDSLPD
jgi:DHA1 family bicyclomycin/chloramphenicol resistance-like MFS transporter